MTSNATLYQTITDQVIAAIESGAAAKRPVMPWHATGALKTSPINAQSGKSYRGINTVALWAAAEAGGYESGRWATFAQWRKLGAPVKRGEKASRVVFWKVTQVKDKDGDGAAEEADSEAKKLFFARAYRVFNADQVKNDIPRKTPSLSPEARLQQAERFFEHLGATVTYGGNSACYVPSLDEIRMPAFEQFVDAPSFYAVLGHEHTHWVGAPSRCDRDLSGRFGSQAYAAEELVAELGAAFLCAELGLSTKPRDDHAGYIQSWLSVLRQDNRAIFTAASKAQQAVDWMMDRQPSG